MWNGFYYKVLDNWTPPLYYLPRWFEANAYPTLTDEIDEPDTWNFTLNTSFDVATNSTIPSSWILTDTSYIPASLTLQSFFKVYVHEKQYMFGNLISSQLSRSFYYDLSEPEFGWVVETGQSVSKLEVLTTSGFIEVSRADSDLELFYGGSWKYRQENSTILIAGLGIQQQVARVDGDSWLFIRNEGLWDSSALVWLEHPTTKSWIPIHPSQIRADGWIGYNTTVSGTVSLRCLMPAAQQTLPQVIVRVDGEQKIARQVNLSTALDDKSMFFHIERRDLETNSSLEEATLQSSWFRDQTQKGLRNFISAALRTGSTVTYSAGTTGFTFPASATGFSIRNIHQYGYIDEKLEHNVDSDTSYRTLFSDPDLGCGFIRGLQTDFVSASGIVTFDTFVDNRIDNPIVHWRLKYWTEIASSIQFESNFPNQSDMVVFFPSKVRVNTASVSTLKTSFNRTSPIFRWRSVADDAEQPHGLAEFDF